MSNVDDSDLCSDVVEVGLDTSRDAMIWPLTYQTLQHIVESWSL